MGDPPSDPPAGDAPWSLRLLDHFSLRGPQGEAGLTARKAVALVIFLALQRERMARRDALANLLWSDVDTTQGRVNLRQAIAAVRRVEQDSPILLADADTVALAPSVEVDTDRFERLAAGSAADRIAAADLYRTDLVAGFALRDAPAFNEWLAIAQAHWRQRAVDVLLSLADAAQGSDGDANAGVTAALKLLSIDPFNEGAHRALMALYARQGRAALALAQYRSLSDLLRRELQVAPDAETQALHERIKAGRQRAAAPTVPTPAPPVPVQSAAAAIEAEPQPPPPVPVPSRRWQLPVAGLAAAALIAGGYAAWRVAGRMLDPAPVIARVYPVAMGDADERQPALSPDGTLVAYTARRDGNVDLYMAALDGAGEGTRLTSHPSVDGEPAWRPDGRAIAFVRAAPGSDAPCAIMVRPIPVGPERQVGRCLNSYTVGLSWSADGGTLYFDDDATRETARRIFALSVADGAVRPVTDLARDAHGDYSPVVSHDGRRLAFQRRRASTSDLLVRDLASGATIVVQRDVARLIRFAWSAGDAGLFYTVFDGPDGGLWWVGAKEGAARARLSSGLMNYSGISAAASGRKLVIQTSQERATVLHLAPGGQVPVPLTGFPGLTGDGFETHMTQARDGRIAVVSSRTGVEQLLVMRPGQGPRVLATAGGGGAFNALAWAPDARTLAAAVTTGGQSSIVLIDAANGRRRRLPIDGGVNSHPAWSADGRHVYWSSLRNRGSALLRASPGTPGRIEPVMAGEFGATRFSADGRFLYYTKVGAPGVFRRGLTADGVPTGPATAILPALPVSSQEDWALTDRAIVFPCRAPHGPAGLCRLDLATGTTATIGRASDEQTYFTATRAQDGGVLITRTVFQNDISGMDFD